jgi:pyridoxamine 5'-phosphate oxidase
MKLSIEKLRWEYGNTPLLEENLHADPVKQFTFWLKEAIESKVVEPNGMTLSTLSGLHQPSGRTVLLKNVDHQGFVFFTNYGSRKGEQLSQNAQASLTFWWREIYRQVSIEGRVTKTSRKTSLDYFKRRPRGAQLAAWVSSQSAPLASREELEETFKDFEKRYKRKEIPCPKNWGGYRLHPERMEFWQGRKDRLHDRFLYVLVEEEWLFSRLFP